MFASLRAMKLLRGSTFDPFGHAASRRQDRQLRDDYIVLVHRLVGELMVQNHDRSVETLNLASMIRGFGDVRARNVEAYENAMRELVATA